MIPFIVGSLETCLHTIADYLSLDADTLATFAAEDQYTGWDYGAGDWPCGSLHRAEGQILYALVKTLKTAPVEIGSFCGCSATHMAAALDTLGISGSVQAIDIVSFDSSRVPPHLLSRLDVHIMDGADYLRSLPDNSQGLIYEDGSHYMEDVRDVWTLAKAKLKPGGVILSHDADHATGGPEIRRGIQAAGVEDYLIVRPGPSDCGLAIWGKGD